MGAKTGSLTGPGEPLFRPELRAWATGGRRTKKRPAGSLSGLARTAGTGFQARGKDSRKRTCLADGGDEEMGSMWLKAEAGKVVLA